MELSENEILCPSHRVKYLRVEQFDGYIRLTQNRTVRRVPVGYYFEDTGTHIYVSPYYTGVFQHSPKVKTFVLDKVTKEWRDYISVEITKHIPEKLDKSKIKYDKSLER